MRARHVHVGDFNLLHAPVLDIWYVQRHVVREALHGRAPGMTIFLLL